MSSWLWWVACAPKPPPASFAPPEVVKSPIDRRSYQVLPLDNGLRALLVSDPDADLAAAALTVHTGHYADPADRMGLAHFLEHMLFMGTDRYPSVDDFHQFVDDHGGFTNAGTSGETTGFYFQVEAGALEPAFDRFSRFFVAPLLDPTYVDRERNAVNAEYSLKIKDGPRRIRQVRKATTNPAHPESKFSVGNLDTLADRGDDRVYEDLRALYAAEYRPDRMTVAVLGREPLSTLAAWVETGLRDVPGGPSAPRAPRPPPYLPDQLGVRIDVVPLEDVRQLELQFPLPPEHDVWPFQPYQYLAALLGHEGAGTWFSALKAAGWIESLSAGTTDDADDHDLFAVTLDLTPEGEAHVDDLVASLFVALDQIGTTGLAPFRYEELDRVSALQFQFAGETDAVATVREAADALWLYPPSHVLDHWAVPGPFSAETVKQALAQMTVERLRVLVTAPGLTTDRTEPLYQVPYAIRPLRPEERAAFAAGTRLTFALPPPNPYLPADTSLEPGENPPTPSRLTPEGSRFEVWHHLDTSFQVPRDLDRLEVRSPLSGRSDRELVLAELAERLLDDALQAKRYPMSQAGMDVSVDFDDRGLTVTASGFDDRKPDLLADVVGAARRLVVDPERFRLERAELVRDWKNLALSRPVTQGGRITGQLLDHGRVELEVALPIAEAATATEVQAFVDRFWDGASARMLVHGNRSAEGALALARTVEATLALPGDAAPVAPIRVPLIPPGTTVVRDVAIDHADSMVVVTVEGPGTGAADHARWMLLGQLVGTPFFTQLRTEQQLGYVVGANYVRFDRVPALQFVVQSGVLGPVSLVERIDAFGAGQVSALQRLDPAAFETVRTGLLTVLRQADVELDDRSRRWARNLALGVETFDWNEAIAAEVERLTLPDLAGFAAEVLAPGHGRLVVRSFGTNHATEREGSAAGCATNACARALLPETYERRD